MSSNSGVTAVIIVDSSDTIRVEFHYECNYHVDAAGWCISLAFNNPTHRQNEASDISRMNSVSIPRTMYAFKEFLL